MQHLSPELTSATIACAYTGLMWVPIILNRLLEMGPWKALKNPEPDVRAEANWAYRLANAHRNAIENLVVFAPLAIAVHVLENGDGITATAGMAYVISRVAHSLLYTAGVPFFRTVAFVVGFAAQMTLAMRVLAWI